jgi:sulfopyruvate decarboxylase alpha subunit
MAWEADVLSVLKENSISLVVYLPDTALGGIIEAVEEDDWFTAVNVAREEEAIGVLSGGWLGGQRGALLVQSSGLANTLNAIGSLSKPARIPFLGLVSRRGDLGEFNLAQVPFGYNMPALLDTMGIRNHSLAETDTVARDVDMAAKSAFSTEEPYVVMLESTLIGAKDEY